MALVSEARWPRNLLRLEGLWLFWNTLRMFLVKLLNVLTWKKEHLTLEKWLEEGRLSDMLTVSCWFYEDFRRKKWDWTIIGHFVNEDGREFTSVQFSSVVQSCLTLWDPMNRSTPGLPVHHQLPESTQTHVHRVGDAIKPSHFLSSPSVLAFNLPQNQGLLKLVSFSHQLAQVSDIQLQRPSFRWIFRTYF